MSEAIESRTTFASGRYSKRKRTQANYRMEELDVEETEVDSEVDIVQPKKKRKTAAPRTPLKRKIFPFLELPAEIRNMIYTYTLTDPSGINFIAVQRNKRRTAERVSQHTFRSVAHGRRRTYYHSNRINNDIDDEDKLPTPLVPSLLAVNKQIHREGCDMLYGNELIFADTVALYAFMINVGPAAALHLKRVRLQGWGWGRASKAYNNACFAVLSLATNLEKFFIDTSLGWYRQPKSTAQQLYRDAFPWLEAIGNARGRFDAALDVLEVSGQSFQRSLGQSDDQMMSLFNAELSRNLGAQQKRIMAKSAKKQRKASKVSA